MSEQITWTHVDKLVRKMHDDLGMLPIGLTDAEVTHAFIKFLMRRVLKAEDSLAREEAKVVGKNVEISRLSVLLENTPKSKTKARLAKLEEQVARLLEWADRE